MSDASPRHALAYVEEELARLEAQDLLRVAGPATRPGDRLIACSNDYLGFARRALVDATRQTVAGAGASALVTGYQPAHAEAEAALARWLQTESCLVFSSGYAANVGTIAALVGRGDLIVSDALNHASIVDGCRLSGARIVVAEHGRASDVDRLLREEGPSARRRLVVSESYFSMDGDSPDLPALRSICQQHDAVLMVDEAHALGVFGDAGRGLCAAERVVPDVLVGTLGKAFGLQGAFVAGRTALRSWLWNRARSFVFSTALSPALARAAALRVEEVAGADSERARLREVTRRLRDAVRGVAGEVPGYGPIVPWMVGAPSDAVRLSEALAELGIAVHPMRPPTVRAGASRLRLTACAGFTDAEVSRVETAIAVVRGALHR